MFLKTKDQDFVWPATAEEAVLVQNKLRDMVRITNDFNAIKIIAGVDVSYDIKSNLTHAFIVLVDSETLKPIADVQAQLPTTFPYIPGFLSFREIPTILEALKKLNATPDLLMVDGQGVAHPRQMGIAAHLGVLLDMPTIGVAKSRLTGIYKEPDMTKGAYEKLMNRHGQIGTVLRSKDNVKPLFISPGHRVDQETALQIVRKCLTKYRLPEPTRLADKFSKENKPQGNMLLL